MIQPANQTSRENGNGMKGEVDSSILSGSTTPRPYATPDYESEGPRFESLYTHQRFQRLSWLPLIWPRGEIRKNGLRKPKIYFGSVASTPPLPLISLSGSDPGKDARPGPST